MPKTMKTARVTGVLFQGETVAAAREHGEHAISTLVQQANNGPSLYHVHGIPVVVWPLLEGWGYRLVAAADKPGMMQANCTMGGGRFEACLAAVSHAAQYAWTHDCVDDTAHYNAAYSPLVAEYPSHLAEIARKRTDSLSLAAWQRRYRVARDAGCDTTDSHDIASRTATLDDAAALARAMLQACSAPA